MAKQTTPAAGHKAQVAARKAGPVTVVAGPVAPTPAPASAALAMLAGTLAAGLPAAAPVAPVTVALRGGMAIAQVRATAKPYRVGAAHNQAWWATVAATLATGQGTATVQALLAAGVPAPFVGYVVRRGYLTPVAV